jgi:hypothetical protein
MNIISFPHNERGHVQFDWLDTYHSFSFGSYHDAKKVHFGALRVLNDDKIDEGMGFGTHPHDNMEIITIPLFGDLHHRDSTGRDCIIKENDVQIMSAGSGIQHSEVNPNRDKRVELFQIWIFPKERNITPRYDQKSFLPKDREDQLLTVVSPNDPNTLFINQDAWLSLGHFIKPFSSEYSFHQTGQGLYAMCIEGSCTIGGQTLGRRDAVGISGVDKVAINADAGSDILLIEIPYFTA